MQKKHKKASPNLTKANPKENGTLVTLMLPGHQFGQEGEGTKLHL